MSERKTFDIGRNPKDGRFMPVKKAEHDPDHTTVERMSKPGRGDSKGEPSRKR